MGARAAYSDKTVLCDILHSIDPSHCYPLGRPDARAVLQQHVMSSSSTLWVLKRDAAGMHLHSGKGVSYIHGWDMLERTVASWSQVESRLSSVRQLEAAAPERLWQQGLVQPYRPPFIGRPPFNRKSEIRILLAIVDTHPMTIYACTAFDTTVPWSCHPATPNHRTAM